MFKIAIGIAIGMAFREPILRFATTTGIILVGKTSKNK
jgi:hypothetical protein